MTTAKRNRKKQFDSVSLLYDFYMHTFGLFREKDIIELLDLHGDEVVCDFGGGTGYLANAVAKHCSQLIVIDESSRMLKQGSKYGTFSIVRGDIRSGCFPAQIFDTVILSDVVHHVSDLEPVLDEARRVLRPNGVLLIYDFDLKFKTTRVMRLFESLLFAQVFFKSRADVEAIVAAKHFGGLNTISRNYWYILRGFKR